MISDFDQNTIANMTAALNYACKKIPAASDTNELRKRIADELNHSARLTVMDLESAGPRVLKEATKPSGFTWFGLRRR
jgi:hypothetical protein